jgi:hypothetical protein
MLHGGEDPAQPKYSRAPAQEVDALYLSNGPQKTLVTMQEDGIVPLTSIEMRLLGIPNLFPVLSYPSLNFHCSFVSLSHNSHNLFIASPPPIVTRPPLSSIISTALMLTASPFHISLHSLCATWHSIVSSTAPERGLDSSKTQPFVYEDNGMPLSLRYSITPSPQFHT